MPKIFEPDFYAPKLENYTPEALAAYGVYPDTVGTDADNTMGPYHFERFVGSVYEWITEWQEAGARVVIGSNASQKRREELIDIFDGYLDPENILASRALGMNLRGKPFPDMVLRMAEDSRSTLLAIKYQKMYSL